MLVGVDQLGITLPLRYRDRLWMLKAGGQVTCLDPETGDSLLDRERLPAAGEYYDLDGIRFTILEADERRINRVTVAVQQR